MSTLLYIIGALAALACGGAALFAQSAIHEILSAVIAVVAVCAIGFAKIIDVLEQIKKTVAVADQNNWTVTKAIWRHLREPEGKHPEPKADGD